MIQEKSHMTGSPFASNSLSIVSEHNNHPIMSTFVPNSTSTTIEVATQKVFENENDVSLIENLDKNNMNLK